LGLRVAAAAAARMGIARKVVSHLAFRVPGRAILGLWDSRVGIWGLGAGAWKHLHSREVSELLLSPHFDHLSRVALAVTVAEAVVARHILVAILEDEDRRLVHLDRHLPLIASTRS
jgi:hypothetical protein